MALNKSAMAAVLLGCLIISVAASRTVPRGESGEEALLVQICSKIYGAQEGDTCFNLIQQFNTTSESFNALNPNLDCDKIFVGQWLCLDGLVL